VVDKDVLAAFTADEPEALLIVEPLHLPLCNSHDLLPMYNRAKITPCA
jgi:hypothetical protein